MNNIDTSVIRPEMKAEEIIFRNQNLSASNLSIIKKGLIALHNLETMAVNIYKYQITNQQNEHNRLLITAMANEMTHMQDFQIKVLEYGIKFSKVRFFYWLLGMTVGFISRLMGQKAVLKTGIWVETKAVHHYSQLLKDIPWDDATRKIIEKDQADEHEHIQRWKKILESL